MSQGAELFFISLQLFLPLSHPELEFVNNRNPDGFLFWGVLKWNRIHYKISRFDLILIFGVLRPLSAIFQLYHGDQFKWWKKPEYPEITTDPGQATGKLYHLRL